MTEHEQQKKLMQGHMVKKRNSREQNIKYRIRLVSKFSFYKVNKINFYLLNFSIGT